MDGYRWNSLIHEVLWYLSGEEHIRDLREETKIWDAWADDEGRLDTAYGRFWRRFPVPDGVDAPRRDVAEGCAPLGHRRGAGGRRAPDLRPDPVRARHPRREPRSRRMVVNAWAPPTPLSRRCRRVTTPSW